MLLMNLLLLLITTSSNLEQASAVRTGDTVDGGGASLYSEGDVEHAAVTSDREEFEVTEREKDPGYIIKLHLVLSKGFKETVNKPATSAVSIVKEASIPFATLNPPVAIKIIWFSPMSRQKASANDVLKHLRIVARKARKAGKNNKMVKANLYVVFVNGRTFGTLGQRICDRHKRDRILWIAVNYLNNPLEEAAPELTKRIAFALGIRSDTISATTGQIISSPERPRQHEGKVCQGFMGDVKRKVFSECSWSDFKEYIQREGENFCLQRT